MAKWLGMFCDSSYTATQATQLQLHRLHRYTATHLLLQQHVALLVLVGDGEIPLGMLLARLHGEVPGGNPIEIHREDVG